MCEEVGNALKRFEASREAYSNAMKDERAIRSSRQSGELVKRLARERVAIRQRHFEMSRRSIRQRLAETDAGRKWTIPVFGDAEAVIPADELMFYIIAADVACS